PDALPSSWSQPGFRLSGVTHVVDCENNRRFHIGFTNPLGSGELGKCEGWVEWVVLVEIGDSIGGRRSPSNGGTKTGQNQATQLFQR
ncbi:MAG: hypothetical protein JWM99_605, partial [Verrucomicrobiales bacterium]|nr:hypothetical protein [Verrucomicrobiales bacterium]